MFDVLVIGSINADLVFTCSKRPILGETVMGDNFQIIPGGKGANQAVASARLGSKVGFVGCVGEDENGKMAIENLKKNKVETKYIEIIKDKPTGVANIIVADGDNSIIVVAGANNEMTKKIIDKNINVIKSSKVVLLQQEIPIDLVDYIIDICHQHDITTILNPAPANKVKKTTIGKVDFLTPNEHEAKIIFQEKDMDTILKKYPNKLIITRGKNGVSYFDKKKIRNIPALEVEVVDTTGAGDAFNGAFASGVAKDKKLEDIIIFANKAAAISVGKFGAQAGMPYISEISI